MINAAEARVLPALQNVPAVDTIAPSALPLVPPGILDLRPGELVEIRWPEEILASLDADGKLDGLPFMAEMQNYCGRRFLVSNRADSTCAGGQPRRIEHTVHLQGLRCDGSAHYGCQAACLILWKEAWLRRASGSGDGTTHCAASNGGTAFANESVEPHANGGSTAERERLKYTMERADEKLSCQATELNSASCPIVLERGARYLAGVVRDCGSAKIGRSELGILARYARGKLVLGAFTAWARAPWNAERFKKTPSERLDLQVGELVQVRSAREILQTLDRNGCNRGMEFKAEMFQFCGRRFPVLARMERRIDERTGMMREFRNECILLAGVHCHGQRSFCARGNYHYWREIWLRRCQARAAPERRAG